MKRTVLLAALLAAAPVFANEIDPHGFNQQVVVSSASRSAIAAETRAAARNAAIAYGEVGVYPTPVTNSARKTRAEVRADAAAALAREEVRYGEIGSI